MPHCDMTKTLFSSLSTHPRSSIVKKEEKAKLRRRPKAKVDRRFHTASEKVKGERQVVLATGMPILSHRSKDAVYAKRLARPSKVQVQSS